MAVAIRSRVARLRRGGPALALAAAIGVLLGAPAHGASFGATASVSPTFQYLGAKGTVFTFTITNTGTTSAIGAVQVTRPGAAWTVGGCPQAPAGWSAQRSTTMCRFTSTVATTDDIAPGGSSSAFQVKLATDGGTTDRTGTWSVVVSQSNRFDNPSLLTSASAAPGALDITAHSFEIVDALVVSGATPAAGTNCPVGTHSAPAGSTQMIVVCGRNRANTTLTPDAAQASLSGTLVAGSGTFTSGPVGKSGANANVVLGTWAGVQVTPTSGSGKTVIAKVGSAANQTSPLTTLAGYEALNPPATGDAQSVSTNEDTARAITLTGSDPEDQPLTFSIVSSPVHGGLSALGPPDCTAVNTCSATLTYTPAADYFGSDSFTFKVNDGAADSATAAVSITINAVNDAPNFTSGGNVTAGEDSGAYSAAWATGITAGPASESGQTLTFNVTGNTDASLFSAGPAISSTGTLSFTPAAEAFGSATIAVALQDSGGTANGGVDTSATSTFTVTLTPVNDAPSFTKGGDVTVLEDSGAYSAAWATGTSAGPANESGQTLTFNVTGNTDASLFNAGPAISSTGTLSFTPAADAFGSATITVALQDSGGTANGGADTSAARTFTLAVTGVNDEPGFALPASPNQDVVQDAGSLTVAGFATAVSAGPANESSQALTFHVSNDNTALFTAAGQPDIDETTGDLTYRSAAGATGSATVSVYLTDNGGTANGGDDTSATKTFTITVSPPNAVPTADATPASGNEDGGAIIVTLTGHDADDDTLTFDVGTASHGLVTGPASVDCSAVNTCTATVTYTPNVDFFGADSFTYKVNDGIVDSAPATASITVNPVNDAPSFTKGANQTVLEDAVAQSVTGWATAISKGPANESGQTLTFNVSNDNNGLFSAQPAVNAGTGNLSYIPAADANGSATVTVSLGDDGGTANGGVDTSGNQTFTITVTAVNDAPSFTKGADVTVDEDAGAQSLAGWATAISKGPANESGQTLSFEVTANDNPALFSAQPAVSSTGTLSFTSGPDLSGTANVTIRAKDNGGTANGGVDVSPTQSFVITVNPVNDAPVADDETFTGTSGAVGNTALVVDAPADGAPTLSAPKKVVTGDILAGDTDVDGPSALAVVAGTFATNDGGSVTLEADGDFIFLPAAGTSCTDTSDFFDYTVSDGGSPALTDTGRVTISISGCVWYVNNNDPTGNSGTSVAPFDTLAQAEAASGAGHTVFVFRGDGTSGGYGGDGYQMNSGEALIGEAAGLTVGADTLLAANPGQRPTLTATDADVVSLDDANTVRSLILDPSGTGGGIAGASGDTGGGTIDDVAVADTGTPGTQPGLELDTTTGTFNVSNLVVSTNGATGVRLNSAGTVVFSPSSQISLTAVGARALDAASTALGTSTFDDITVTGAAPAGVVMTNTTGTIALGDESGTDLSLTTTGGSGLVLSNAGTVTVGSGGTDTISATGGPAVNVTGAASLDFDDVDSTNSSTTGVSLASFATGTFNAPSGSAISGSLGTGFSVDGGNGAVTFAGTLTNTAGRTVAVANRTGGTVDFNGVVSAIGGTGVLLSGNGAGLVRFDGGLTLSTGTSNAFTATGSGTVAVTDPNAVGTAPDNTLATTTGVALSMVNVTIHGDGLNFKSVSAGTAASGPANGIVLSNTGTNAGLTVSGTGSAGTGGTIQKTTDAGVKLTNTKSPSFNNLHIQDTGASGIDGTQVTNFTFTNGVIDNSGTALGVANSNIGLNHTAGANETNVTGTVTITGNTLTNAYYHGIDLFNYGGTIDSATISGNTITSATSTASSKGAGIHIVVGGTATATSNLTRATIDANTITGFPSDAGIFVSGNNGSTTAPGATMGDPASATNVIDVTDNLVSGFSAANRMGTNAILININGGNASRSKGHWNVSGNGTVATPVGNNLGTTISMTAFGNSDVKATIDNNQIVANNTAASQGIGVGTSTTGGSGAPFNAQTPNFEVTITNNAVSATDGNGILAVARDASATLRTRIQNNTVAAPITGVRPGIRLDAGNASSVDDAVCLNISGNTSAGSGGHQGIGLRKQGTVAGTNDFAVNGMAATASPGVEAYVNSLNPAGSGTLLISATSGFSNCTLP